MTETVLVALISASAALIVGLTGVSLNVFWMGKTFDQLASTIDGVSKALHARLDQIDTRLDRVDIRLDRIEDDLKTFYRVLSEHSTDIARLKDKSDLK